MHRQKRIIRLSDNNLENTLYNVVNKGIDNYDSSYLPSSSRGDGKPRKINTPIFNNPFSNVKIPEITVTLEPGTKKMIDTGIKILSASIVIHGLFTFFKR